MGINRIGKITTLTIDLREIAPDGTTEAYLSQFPTEIGEILKRVLQAVAGPNETIKVDVMDGQMLIEEHKYFEGLTDDEQSAVICDLTHKMTITIAQEFPLGE